MTSRLCGQITQKREIRHKQYVKQTARLLLKIRPGTGGNSLAHRSVRRTTQFVRRSWLSFIQFQCYDRPEIQGIGTHVLYQVHYQVLPVSFIFRR
jgi:hypothetical protein